MDPAGFYLDGPIDPEGKLVVELKLPIVLAQWLYQSVVFIPVPLELFFWNLRRKSSDFQISSFLFCIGMVYQGLSDCRPSCFEKREGP